MSSAGSIILSLVICFSLGLLVASSSTKPKPEDKDPVPAKWPKQFHSVLLVNNSDGSLQKKDLWYDWPNGRNLNLIQYQLGELMHSLLWDNGTSFYYTLDSNKKCDITQYPIGILTPNWLHGATYVGRRYVDNILCNVWEKVDFITYSEDVASKRPVSWTFYNGKVLKMLLLPHTSTSLFFSVNNINANFVV